MLYTVKNMVVENHELVYNDDVVKLFLYTKGKHGGSEELRTLLTYTISLKGMTQKSAEHEIMALRFSD